MTKSRNQGFTFKNTEKFNKHPGRLFEAIQ